MNNKQCASHRNLDPKFWHLLRDSINMKRYCPSVKSRINIAKRILKPIIEDVMTDALKQVEAASLKSNQHDSEIKEKEIKVLHNELAAKDAWHLEDVDGGVAENNSNWTLGFLRKISRDLEKPFEKLNETLEDNNESESTAEEVLLNETLLDKLTKIHEHLGYIIRRLKNKCDKSEEILKQKDIDLNISKPFMDKKRESQVDRYSNSKDVYNVTTAISLTKVRNCQPSRIAPVAIGKTRASISSPDLHKRVLFEEKRNEVGHKVIIINRLEDLEKVRRYLEGLQNNMNYEKPGFSSLETCKNENCIESQPHMHTNLPGLPLVLKLNKHAELNELKDDLIIGIPGLTKSSVGVELLINRDYRDANEMTDKRNKRVAMTSIIPKGISGKRVDIANTQRNTGFKIILGSKKENPMKRALNLVVFDPDDPCRSIIKMKEQKRHTKQPPLVSNFCYSKKYRDTKTSEKNPFWPEIYVIESNFDAAGHNQHEVKFIHMIILGVYVNRQVCFEIYSMNMILEDPQIFKMNIVDHRWNLQKLAKYYNQKLNKCKTRIFVDINVSFNVYHSFLEERCVKTPRSKKSFDRIFPSLLNSLFQNMPLLYETSTRKNLKERFYENYMKNLFSFISSMKGSIKKVSYKSYKHKFNKKKFQEKTSFNLIESDITGWIPAKNKTLQVYFFECFCEKRPKHEFPNSNWNWQGRSLTAYPVWKIRKSKYYNVPKSKTREKEIPKDSLQKTESTESKLERLSQNQLQISEVSFCKSKNPESKLETSDSESKKTEVIRKVSFRDEVDFSGSVVDYSPALAHVDSISERNEQFMGISNKLSDLLMTESLLPVSEDLLNAVDKPKRPLRRNLNFTESAQNILAKLSKSFEDKGKNSFHVLETLDGRLISQFYDEKGDPITEVYNADSKLIAKVRGNDIQNIASFLFDTNGFFIKTRYNFRGKRIRAVYDANKNIIKQIVPVEQDIMKNIRTDLDFVKYYDYKGRPIKFLYNSTGYKIKQAGNDLTSTIFKDNGHLHTCLYNKNGKIIDVVYNSKGQILGEISNPRLHPKNERTDCHEGDSLSVLLQEDGRYEHKSNVNLNKSTEGSSFRKFFDQDGNPLTSVYDRKGKPIKVTSSGEAHELAPYLFDNKGKIQTKRYDAKGRELKAVFGEDGKAISEMSIPWLSALLAASGKADSKPTKRESFFRRKSKSPLKKLYNIEGNILTGVYDSEGNALSISKSGDAAELLPFLFDDDGKFIKRRYDSKNRNIEAIYDRNGDVISTLSSKSLSLFSTIHIDKMNKSHQQQENTNRSEIKINHSREDTPIFGKIDTHSKEPQDSNNISLKKSSTGIGLRLFSSLFETKGKHTKKNRKSNTVHDKSGNVINKALLTAPPNENKVKVNDEEYEENVVNPDEAMEPKTISRTEKEDNYEFEERGLSSLTVQSSCASPGVRKVSMLKSSVQIPECLNCGCYQSKQALCGNEQLKTTCSMTSQQRSEMKCRMREEEKYGASINKFYDRDGNVITSVYDGNGRALVKTASGDIAELLPFLFDQCGTLQKKIYDRQGIKLKTIYDEKGVSISRISMPQVESEDEHDCYRSCEKIPGSVYDEFGYLLTEIFDSRGHPIIITKLAKFDDLAPIIFDENGVRRKIYNSKGIEIGPLFDYKGHLLEQPPLNKESSCSKQSKIYSRDGRLLRNYYNSNGCLISGLYNDHGKSLSSIGKADNNVDEFSKFFFDKYGHFLRGRFFDIRGHKIKQVYDSNGNIIDAIKKTRSRQIAYNKTANRDKGYKSSKCKNMRVRHSTSHTSEENQRAYYRKSEVRPVANITTRNLTSHSDTMLKCKKLTRSNSFSGYASRCSGIQDGVEYQISFSSLPAVMPVKKFYDEHGKLLTGVYNSRNRVLGYSESGNARVLAPYLIDGNGHFVSGRYDPQGKPLKQIYNSTGVLVNGMSKPDNTESNEELRLEFQIHRKQRIFYDYSGCPITSIYDFSGNKIISTEESSCYELTDHLFDDYGNLAKNLYTAKGNKIREIYDKHHKIVRKISPLVTYSQIHHDKEENENTRNRKRISLRNNFKDEILTVIFNNQPNICQKISTDSIPEKTDNTSKKLIPNEVVSFRRILSRECLLHGMKSEKETSRLYDKNQKIINSLYNDRGKKITKVFDSSGNLICNLYSPSGNLIKNHVLKSMFEDDGVFSPKGYDSAGNVLTTIYANKRMLTRVYDENKNPAKLDSDLIYLVSDQSLPDHSCTTQVKSSPKQINYFSQGSEYPFPEGELSNEQIDDQYPLTSGSNYYGNDPVIILKGYSRKRADSCVCEHCQKMGKNKRNLSQWGENLLKGLSKFTIPIDKFLSRAFLRRSREAEERRVDSLEELIDQAINQESKGTQLSECSHGGHQRLLLEGEDKIPISRDIVEKTLMGCVHLSSSTNVVGKISDSILQHFATLILQEIKEKFFSKLDDLHEHGSQESVCVGTELKFEDSLIGKHSLVQTSRHSVNRAGIRTCARCLHYSSQEMVSPTSYEFSREDSLNYDTFTCETYSPQSLTIIMESKSHEFGNSIGKKKTCLQLNASMTSTMGVISDDESQNELKQD